MSKQETLAQRIARLLEAEPQPADLASLYASIEKMNHRLDKLEATLNPQSASSPPAGGGVAEALRGRGGGSNPQSNHPSLQKFDIAEAVAEEIFVGLQKEKACTFEPNGKPCDHCSMCNSRGF